MKNKERHLPLLELSLLLKKVFFSYDRKQKNGVAIEPRLS